VVQEVDRKRMNHNEEDVDDGPIVVVVEVEVK